MEVYKIVTLKDPVTGEKLLPRIPQGLQYEVVGDEITPPIDLTLDASTLQGHPASDFVLKSESGTSYVKGDNTDPPETLNAGSFYETSDGYLYIGNSENQPVEVLTLAHELNIGTINGLTVDQLLTAMASKGIGIYNPNGVFIQDYSDIITGQIALGSVVTMADTEWLVSHFDPAGKVFYMTKNTIQSTIRFGDNNVYNGSTLASVAAQYEATLPENVKNRLLTWTINGVTQKVQVASQEQMNGGFSYFDSNGKRIALYNGSAISYWTSSPHSGGNVWYVTDDGSLNNGGLSYTLGFRPSVCLSM